MTKEELERYLAEGLSLKQIGKHVGREKSTISYHLKKHGLKPVGVKYTNKGALPKNLLDAMVNEEISLSEMARRLDRNVSSVRHWLINYGLWPLPSSKRRADAQCAREMGLKRVEMDCRHHGRTEFILEGRGSYRCMKCRREGSFAGVATRSFSSSRRQGDNAQLCGYHEFPGALQFHHLDPTEKSFGLAMRGLTRSIEELRKEAAKCILLCANCHANVEWGSARITESVMNDGSTGRGKLDEAA